MDGLRPKPKGNQLSWVSGSGGRRALPSSTVPAHSPPGRASPPGALAAPQAVLPPPDDLALRAERLRSELAARFAQEEDLLPDGGEFVSHDELVSHGEFVSHDELVSRAEATPTLTLRAEFVPAREGSSARGQLELAPREDFRGELAQVRVSQLKLAQLKVEQARARQAVQPQVVQQLVLPHRVLKGGSKDDPDRAPRRKGPILPFFGVLLRGRDAGLFDREPPRYHPSVGYAREVYVAVLMNWFVDLFGFTYLFHSYLASWQPFWLPWAMALVLGVAFSTAFATFALSLVRKPLSDPQYGRKEAKIAGMMVAAGIGGHVVGAIIGHGSTGVLFELASAASWVSLAGGVALWLVTTFGFQDGGLVFTRATIMLGVGYLVAGPLHEAMFQKEILHSFREQGLRSIEAQLAAAGPALEQARDGVMAACLRAHKVPVPKNGEGSCEELKRERGRADLLVQAIDFVKEQELSGVDASANRTFLVDSAMKLEATAVVALLGTGASGKAGEGRRYQQAVAMEPQAIRQAKEAQEAEASCVAALGECEQTVASDPTVRGLSVRLAELNAHAEVLRNGSEQPGAIERALALEAILAGEGGADAARRAEILNGKLLAAWFLAMVMPIIVLVMKISAGDKLEPYLRKRWAGR